MTAPTNWSFTTSGTGACPCTIWESDATPGEPVGQRLDSVRAGRQVHAQTPNGWVSGVRFYKGTGNSGTHTGSLWTDGGTLLATGTFTGETASGWQTLEFPTAVQVTGWPDLCGQLLRTQWRLRGRPPATSTALAYSNSPLTRASRRSRRRERRVRLRRRSSSRPTDLQCGKLLGGSHFLGHPAAGPRSARRGNHEPSKWPDQRPATNAAVSFTFDKAGAGEYDSVRADRAGRHFRARHAFLQLVNQHGHVHPVGGQPRLRVVAQHGLHRHGVGRDRTLPGQADGGRVQLELHHGAATPPPGSAPAPSGRVPRSRAIATANDSSAINLGVQFTADENGFITGIRFYKGAGNTGTHVGSLWDVQRQPARPGDLHERVGRWLAASQLLDADPGDRGHNIRRVLLRAERRLLGDVCRLCNAGVDNSPLHVPASSAVSGGNGVYLYAVHRLSPTTATTRPTTGST